MSLATNIKGLDEARRSLRNIVQRMTNAAPLLKKVAFGLANMWRANIEAGPNERWEAGASRRVRTDAGGGVTLRDRGLMKASIQGAVTSATSVSIGSALPVRGRSGDRSLLAVHEFGTTINAAPGKSLAIPLTAQARRTAPRDMPGLFMIKRQGRAPLLVTPLIRGRGKARGTAGLTPQYILLKSVRIPARPTAPVDWKTVKLLPNSDQYVRALVGDYVVGRSRGGSVLA